jgi:hypothetical protein
MTIGRMYRERVLNKEAGLLQLFAKVTVSSGTPTLSTAGNGGISSIARATTGKWTITLLDEYASFLGGSVSFLDDAECGRVVQFGSESGSTKSIAVWFYDTNSPGNLADPSDCTVCIQLNLDIMSSTE